MRNSSQNAGCILRLPASHSCHPRRVQWMRAAAAVCESPAASRAARTSSGAGFRAGIPARLRLGWLVVKLDPHPGVVNDVNAVIGFLHFQKRFNGRIERAMCREMMGLMIGPIRVHDAIVESDNMEFMSGCMSGCIGHFGLLPLISRGAVEATAYGSNNTRIAYICKGVLKIFFGGPGNQAKPSNA